MRVLSYNIHKGIGGRDRQYQLERILTVIEEAAPDFVCLQEVDQNVKRSRYDDQPQLIADHLQFTENIFNINVPIKKGGYGNLLLSRWEILDANDFCLKLNYKKKRSAQSAVIETPEGKLHLVGCHLSLLEKQRQRQMAHLFQHDAFQQAKTFPTIILGDLNDWLNKLDRSFFQEQGFTQVTQPISKFRSFPAFLPLGNLDKAFVGNGVEVTHAQVIKNKLTQAASDHLPLVIDFNITS